MKIKRYKHARRILNFYKRNFGLREPYQIIVDGTFSQAALKGKIQIKEQLPKYFGGEVQLVTTRCVISELRSLGKELSGAMYVAKRFQQRKCSHEGKKKSATECILSLIGEDNSHHYFVASQDPELKGRLHHLPGVPLLHIIRNTIVLEKPSDTTHDKAEQLLEARLEPEEHQKAVIETLNKAAGLEGTQRKRKPRRRKGPNPLSVKKSQKRFVGDRVIGGGVVSRSKRRRSRLQKSKAVKLLAQIGSSLSKDS